MKSRLHKAVLTCFLLVLAVVFLAASSADESVTTSLDHGFAHPPDAAKPWVYWFWVNGNITRDGITKDLEEMKKVGVGGALIMEITGGIDAGPVAFISPQWRDLMKHAITEANRLGIVIDLNNDAGWWGSGGPWVKPDGAMQQITWSETRAKGPARFSARLPAPPSRLDYYRDIAVFAFPTPTSEEARMSDAGPHITSSDPKFDLKKVLDGDLNTWAMLPSPKKGSPQFITLEFPKPFTARSLIIRMGPGRSNLPGRLEVSNDGREFKIVREIAIPVSGIQPSFVTANFDAVKARWFRLSFDKPVSLVSRVALAEIELLGGARIEHLGGKASFIRGFNRDALGPDSIRAPELAVPSSALVNLTDRIDAKGLLTWDVPEGDWTILRVGHTPTGVLNHPSAEAGLGLECDKLSCEALNAHFEGMMAKIIADAGPLAGKSLRFSHVDSWEVGDQNWTPKFREEFHARRGYDPLPWLPVMTGRIVQSLDLSERFLWDVRRTISQLLADYYYGHLAELCHKHDMEFSVEPYGHGPINTVTCGGQADMPMSEFWTGSTSGDARLRSVVSAGHVYGRRVIGAEAFTSKPENARWMVHPYKLKALGDWAYANGINRFVFHRFALQPWTDRKPPAMTMGRWGINYEWTNTWWNQSAAWIQYLSRCQFLLQHGLFVADLLYFTGEHSPIDRLGRDDVVPPPPNGYDFDECDAEALLTRASVKDGRIVFPDGISYRMLILPDSQTITPKVLKKIGELIKAGVVVMGPKPSRSPSLEDYPNCDNEVKSLADELWGDCDGKEVTQHAVGKGRIVWGEPLDKALVSLGAAPDAVFRDAEGGEEINWIHRRDRESDIYFVANPAEQERKVVGSFRVTGKAPELWYPDTGKMVRPAMYRAKDGRIELPIHFDPCGSAFVVFQSADVVGPVASVARNGKLLYPPPPPPPAAQTQTALDNNRSVTDNFTLAGWVTAGRDIGLPEEANQGIHNRDQNYCVYPAPGHEVWGSDHAGAGISMGRNGVAVFEHSAGYFAPLLVYAAPISGWTHVAVVYKDKTPCLYINGQLARNGLRSAKTVHSALGVTHTRKVAAFDGHASCLRQIGRALSDKEIEALAASPLPAKANELSATIDLALTDSGKLETLVTQGGAYEIKTANGKSAKIEVAQLPPPIEIAGPWELRFPPNWGAPEKVTLEKLISWKRYTDPGVRHFSGTATYLKDISVPPDWLSDDKSVSLELGRVEVIAEVKINGKDFGVLWKPPFRINATSALKPGRNRLEVHITNLWPNRMIGDESLPEDKRYTWTPLKFFKKDDPLVESGLLGPVVLKVLSQIRVD